MGVILGWKLARVELRIAKFGFVCEGSSRTRKHQ